MKHWTGVILRGTVYTLMILLSCGLLFGCQDRDVANQAETVYESGYNS